MNSRTLLIMALLTLCHGHARAQNPPMSPIEWKTSEGGNGHWYGWYPVDGDWESGRTAARLCGAELVTITSQAENNFILQRVAVSAPGTWWTGGTCDTAGWQWLSAEPWGYENWKQGSSPVAQGLKLIFFGSDGKWEAHYSSWNPISSIFEWSADCNGDGIVDYGQIKSGQLADENANGVPDICEVSVTGVVPPSVPSQGGSAITIKGNNFPENPVVSVGGLPAANVVRVSATRITAASPSLQPGMASVKVNGFTLEEALYVRPQCGSDLDQDGEVTAADIAIVLLDFGPCYATATSTQPEDSTPFMLREQADAAAPRAK